MSKEKKLEDFEFMELVEEHTRNTHSELLAGGGAGLRNGIFRAMEQAILWRAARDRNI
jgi:hypothetical protein